MACSCIELWCFKFAKLDMCRSPVLSNSVTYNHACFHVHDVLTTKKIRIFSMRRDCYYKKQEIEYTTEYMHFNPYFSQPNRLLYVCG